MSRLPRVVRRHPARSAGVGAFVALTTWWLLAWRLTGNQVEFPRVVDDGFYYFQISQNLAEGHGITMDRLQPTSGFHPLWMLLGAAAFALTPSAAAGVAAVQVASLALVGMSVALLVRALLPRMGAAPTAVAVAALVFPVFLVALTAGLETALVMALMLALVVVMVEAPGWATGPSTRRRLLVGGLLALLVLSRLDNGLVVAAVSLTALARAWRADVRSPAALVRLLAPVVAPAAVATAGWMAALVVIDGAPVPISGQLKTSFPHPGWHLDQALVLPLVAMLAVALVGWAVGRRRPRASALLDALRPLTVAALGLFAFTVLFWSFAPQTWDFMMNVPPGLLGLAIVVDAVLERMPRLAPVAVAGAVVVTALGLGVSGWRYWGSSPITASTEAGEWARAELPPDTVMAMEDSGAFTFHSGLRVLNLDGLVASRAFGRAVCEGRTEEFLAERGVAYVAQDLVSADVLTGRYETYQIPVFCRLGDGPDDHLVVHRADQVFQGTPYRVFREGVGGDQRPATNRLTIWRWRPPS